MPIHNCKQPDILNVNDEIRLKKYDGKCEFAFPWYQYPDTVYLVDGVKESYSMEKLERMYHYLDEHGELYFIEHIENGQFMPIGDVTFWQHDMPIVIGCQSYRGKGIGKRVIGSLIERGKELGYSTLYVNEIYKYNIASQKAFEGMGFIKYEETDNGYRYRLDLAE